MFHKIHSVAAVDKETLIASFTDGTIKEYNLHPLIEMIPSFHQIVDNPEIMEDLQVDAGGYGIIWNDDLDLSSEEIWENGHFVETPFSGLMSFSEAAQIWNLDESTLRKAVSRGLFVPEKEIKKFGKQWVITKEAMIRHFGNRE